jgi:hypothetical protein
MGYRELTASPDHSAAVACLWVRDPEPLARQHRVLPDACVDVVWAGDRRLFVAGPATGAVLSVLPAHATALGVRFRIGAAGAALGLPASELLDATVALEATRECRRLCGLPPAALLRNRASPAGERSDLFKTARPVPVTLAA